MVFLHSGSSTDRNVNQICDSDGVHRSRGQLDHAFVAVYWTAREPNGIGESPLSALEIPYSQPGEYLRALTALCEIAEAKALRKCGDQCKIAVWACTK